jgi:hypothetical protein
MKTGPEEVRAGSLYAFSHQAYWGFRYLREHKESLWLSVKTATIVSEIQEIGVQCAGPNAMPGAGYGAIGAMTWLARDYVAREILAAKNHAQYPSSERPTSEDRRMIFLGVATAAGIFELSIGTALRKLAEAKLGLEKISEHVHRFDQFREMVISSAFVWAVPVSNFFWRRPNGEWILLHNLPCEVPKNWQGGFIVYGETDSGTQATFSRTLPIGLESIPERGALPTTEQSEVANLGSPTVTQAPNHIVCECGTTIAASDGENALKVLAEHKRLVHDKDSHL